MNQNKYFDRIDAYYNEQLSASEKAAFEKELENTPSLQEAVEKYHIALKAVKLLSEEAMKNKFQHWRKEKEPKIAAESNATILSTNNQKKYYLRPYLRAASILLIITALAYFLIENTSNKTDETIPFASFHQPLNVDEFMSIEEENKKLALMAYKNKSPQKAIVLFNQIDQQTSEIQYYLAHSYFLSKDYHKAEQLFRNIVEQNNSAYVESAEWGVLASLYEDKTKKEKFDSLLNKICSDNHHNFHTEALLLRTQLNKTLDKEQQ